MQKTLNIIMIVILSLFTLFVGFNSAKAGPFTDKNRLGDLMMVMAPAYAWGMTVMEDDWEGTIQLGELMLGTQLVVEGIKALKLEERPNHSDKKSFPSGHAAGAFAGAMFVHKRYGWKPALIPYGMSLITSWSRVEVKAHYIHDTIAGAAVSALLTWGIVDKYLPDGVSVDVDANNIGISFKTSF